MSGRELRQTRLEAEEKLARFFADVPVECPYGQPCEAVYHQASFVRLSEQDMGSFLASGYRRNGNCLYDMRCPACRLCVPVRLRPECFRPDRNQRRVWRKNQDVHVELAALTMSGENLALLQHFLDARFPEGRNRAESYYDGFFITSVTRCFEIRYRLEERLLGVAVVDGGAGWLNAVYFFFDPEQAWRSPGTLNILTLIHLCRGRSIPFLYLGYWIKGLSAMAYKSAFRPHELLLAGRWEQYP